jgi:hypothetical protein
MSLAYFDCTAGAGGDMIVASLLDAGCDLDALRQMLSGLKIEGYTLAAGRVNRRGLCGTQFLVEITGEDHPHRHLGDVLEILEGSNLPDRVRDRSREIFTRLGRAEAHVHGVTVEQVHFHEVGAIDSIVDIVGSCCAMELLEIDRVLCGPVPLGSGTIECDHGLMPVPAPATAELLRGAKTCRGCGEGEKTTPTAAAILTTLAEDFGPPPAMRIDAIGLGAGTRDDGPLPNLLRVLIGQADEDAAADTVVELSANLDDCTGEVIGSTIEALLAGGALDAWAQPIVMKKSRPGWMLSALCAPCDAEALEEILFRETPTFGVRRALRPRTTLRREHRTVETAYGPVRIKLGRRSPDAPEMTAEPEFEDCRAAARSHHVSVREVLAEARRAWREGRMQ